MTLRTEYEFVLPRGYVDQHGALHTQGVMRLATARDELEPLRDPTVSGPDDPRLTILVLARVVRRLGTLELVTPHEIENLFAADLAYLQDFYGVINFGDQVEYEALLRARHDAPPPPTPIALASLTAPAPVVSAPPAPDLAEVATASTSTPSDVVDRRPRRSAIEEIPASGR